MRRLVLALLFLTLAASAASCGKKGPPEPPDEGAYLGRPMAASHSAR